MGFLFSKKKKSDEHFAEDDVKKRKKGRVTAHDKAVLDLKVQRDKLKQYQKRVCRCLCCSLFGVKKRCVSHVYVCAVQMTGVVEKEKETARELLKSGQKDKALLVMKKKKRQEQLLAQCEAQLDNVSQMIDSVEFAQMEKDVFDKLKSGNEVLTALNKEMSVEKVEALMSETEEALAAQREIEEALAGYLTTEDDADIEEELAALDAEQEEELAAQMPDVPETEAEAEAAAPQKAKAAKQKEAVLA